MIFFASLGEGAQKYFDIFFGGGGEGGGSQKIYNILGGGALKILAILGK